MTPLEQLICERIQREGPLSFADYMRLALYEPHYGYYVTGPARMGWEGRDYFTSSDVTPLFAHCMGRQLLALWEQLARPTPFIVVEQGAGRGDLGRAILSWAQQEQPALHAALHYSSEDIKSGIDALQNAQMRRASETGETGQPHVLLSNELIDAFPVHVLEVREQRLYEVFVDLYEGRLREILMEPETLLFAAYLAQYRVPWQSFPDGWRCEINLDALSWVQTSAQRLSSSAISTRQQRRSTHGTHGTHGYLLAIDYGEKARDLYTRERQRGTLACYFRHQFNEQPLRHPGEQDITAHVNFSALIAEGRTHGLRLHTFTTQRAWLERNGLYEELEQMRVHEFALADRVRASDQGQVALLQWYNLRQRAATLTDPHSMGNFKVLIMKA